MLKHISCRECFLNYVIFVCIDVHNELIFAVMEEKIQLFFLSPIYQIDCDIIVFHYIRRDFSE